ncbi:hypothetical protein GSI_06621 [Ganoderma sinense ZZ0214-1]|uniref:Uncharacterized protein n=1 Tax=Ganoderma sinense ZZ0214-1 TaxID=1077348 RepID=A0A2G8SDW3_9APHY|nr:hypothetical protein GSI_06621 [Ganoderma sinense ZZ0214-1]
MQKPLPSPFHSNHSPSLPKLPDDPAISPMPSPLYFNHPLPILPVLPVLPVPPDDPAIPLALVLQIIMHQLSHRRLRYLKKP